MSNDLRPKLWMSYVLLAAGVYNAAWGFGVVVFPVETLGWAGLKPPVDGPQIWQCLGMVIGVYGVGYAIAAKAPYRHWPIVFVGLLGKLLGPIGFFMNRLAGTLPGTMAWTILFNDVIWWIPFSIILWGALRSHQATATAHAADFVDDDPLHDLVGSTGQSLSELSEEQPQLVIFLRHLGCTFCREAIVDLQVQRSSIERTGTGIVLVHLGDDAKVEVFLARFGLQDLPRFADPSCRLYRQFGLELGGFRQLLGLKVWLRGMKAGLVAGHGVGVISGNPFQMPGAFVIHCGRSVAGYQHEAASDRPNYLKLVLDSQSAAEAAAV